MGYKFVKNYPALYIPDKKTITITDLHIGIEHELLKSGINIPKQVSRMKKEIYKLIQKTKAEQLVILGDIKHIVPGISYLEEKDIPEFLKELSEKIKVNICLGNHDTYIKQISPEKVKIYDSTGFKIGKYGFIHGHAWPSKKLITCDYLIMGHIHPTIQFVDKFGYRIVEQVWVKGFIDKEKIKNKYKVKKVGRLEVVIIPAFNRLLGGISVNTKTQDEELLGPLLKNKFINLDKCELYLLDGTYLGKLEGMEWK